MAIELWATAAPIDRLQPAFPKEKSFRMLLRCPQGTGGDKAQPPFKNRCGGTELQPSEYIHPKPASSGSEVPAHSVPVVFEVLGGGTGKGGSCRSLAPICASTSSELVIWS